MKIAIILLLVGFNFSACELGSVSYKPTSEGQVAITGPTPRSEDTCVEADFKPKTEREIALMTPCQLFDEQVKTEIYRDTFHSLVEWADYGVLVSSYIRKSGVNMLPVLTEFLNGYDPKNASKCEATRFFVASFEANNLDRRAFRLRGSNEGKLTISALEQAVERMKKAGYDDKKRDYDDNRRFRIHESYLENLKGVNEIDRAAQDTFWVNRKMVMSHDELLEFSNFLVSLDPTYPAWSEMDWFKDHSRINEAGSPAQVLVFRKPERYHEAYLQFKKTKDAGKMKK